MQTSIIIADDHPILIKGLQDFLIQKKYNVVGTAINGKDAYKLIIEQKPDIAILDIRMPLMNGIEIAKECKDKVNTKIVLLTFEKNGLLYKQAKALNVYGYLLKEFGLNEIENCLKSVQNNLPYFSPETESYFSSQNNTVNLSSLTLTENKILKLIAQNKTAKDIAELFNISKRTVEKHKSNIIRKLDINHLPNSLLIWVKENQDYFL